MPPQKNFYQVLGVTDSASAAEIKKAYRKLAKKYHPDATGGDKAKEATFKEISEAYETLGDDKKRAAYDEMRRNPFAGGGGRPGAAGYGNVDFDDLFSQFGGGARGGRVHVNVGGGGSGGGFSDIFGNIFGGGMGGGERRAPTRGQDVIARLEIELPEAALGAERTIVIDGKRLNVKIPAGVTDGKTIRLSGQGEAGGRGAPAGDLLIELHERPHPRFKRRPSSDNKPSSDIEVDFPVPLDVAVLGGKADVATLEGKAITLTVPPGTSSGRKLRVKGKGAVGTAGTRGDLYANVSVQVPKPEELPAKAKEALAEFARLTKR